MSESSSFQDVPAGKIAAVVTYLEMRARPARTPSPAQPPQGVFRRVESPQIDWYLDLFRRIGEDLLWYSRPALACDELTAILENPHVEIHALQAGGIDAGLVELDFRREGECELAFLGLTPDLVGSGTGRWLMNKAIELAWSRPINRFWVHTCTLDHPESVAFYLRAGFTACARQIEIADDPRLTGALRREAAPGVPVIEK